MKQDATGQDTGDGATNLPADPPAGHKAPGHHGGQSSTGLGTARPRTPFSVSPPQPDDLPVLRQQFPGFEIWREVTGERTRYIARRRHTWLSPHTVVTADPDELRAVLHQDEYPQAIADDYPGWGIEHRDGQWTAWCPAMTVHADTAYGLRAAIEHAINGDNQEQRSRPAPGRPTPDARAGAVIFSRLRGSVVVLGCDSSPF